VLIAFDEQYPVQVVELASKLLEGHDLRCVGEVWGKHLRGEENDDAVLLGLSDLGADIVCTLDASMLELPQVLLAIEYSKLTVATVEAVGHRELRALGATLLWLPDVIAATKPDEPQIFRWKPKQSRESEHPKEHLARLATKKNISVGQLRREARAAMEANKLDS
jgi:uncharacterized circularly permuted ATP-grasp superfamily protein